MEIDINDIATLGVARDTPAYEIAPEAWTTALNMRARDGGLLRLPGWAQVFGTPGVAPHFAIPVVGPSSVFWLYTSLTKGYVYDGNTHTNITRQSVGVDVDYTAGNTREWNGTLFAGVPILNNGVDAPQFWGTLSVGTKLADLTNWPAATSAAVIRSLGAYLVGIYITKSGTVYQHLVKWSSSVTSPGSLPGSWNEADETVDAGEYDLPDVDSGSLVDALNLGSRLILYKEQSTWAMRFIGGRTVMAFDTLYGTLGILAPRCVSITGNGRYHVVATQDDLVIHDATSTPVSIIDKKLRKEIFATIDTTNYLNSFTFTDSLNDEVWFCFPESGLTYPNRALIFNYRLGTLTEADGITFRGADSGRIESSAGETWDAATGTWDTDTGTWNTQERRKVVLFGTDDTMFFKANEGVTRNGAAFVGTLQRTGLALIGRKRTGEWIVNHQVYKFVDRIWPKIKGNLVQVRVGFADVIDGSVTWGAYQTFDPATDVFVDPDPPVQGRAIAVEFRASADWRLDGYRININSEGQF